jgi:hypothetical protein
MSRLDPLATAPVRRPNTLGAVPNGLHSLPVGQVGTPAQPHPGRDDRKQV